MTDENLLDTDELSLTFIFKTPDIVNDTLEETLELLKEKAYERIGKEEGDDREVDERIDDELIDLRERLKDQVKKYIAWGEQVKIRFDVSFNEWEIIQLNKSRDL